MNILSATLFCKYFSLFSVFENSEKMILVMEYCSGGELYDYLSQKKVLQEDEARRSVKQSYFLLFTSNICLSSYLKWLICFQIISTDRYSCLLLPYTQNMP